MAMYRRLISFLSATRAASTSSIVSPSGLKSIDDLPGPPEFPVFGTFLDHIFHKGGLAKARVYVAHERVREYGKIYYEKIGPSRRQVHIADLEDVERVLRDEPSYPKRFNSPLFKYFWKAYNRKPGVFFLDGIEWHKHRSSLKRMLVPRDVAQYTPTMNEISSEFIARLKTLCAPESSDTNYEVADLDKEMFKWSFEAAAYVLFGKRFGALASNIDPKVDEFIVSTDKFLKASFPTLFVPTKLFDYYQTEKYKTFASSYDKMYEIVEGFFMPQSRREFEKSNGEHSENSTTCLLHHLLFEEKLSKDEILYSFLDLLFAGVDTTGYAMQWVLYELAKNPDKQEALFAEITTVLPESITRSQSDNSRSIQVVSEDLQRLPYLRAVVQETLRLHPAVPYLSRVLQKDVEISGYKVPASTQVNMMSRVMSRDPHEFVEPERFVPERWLRSNENDSCGFNKFASLPFGFGRRMCIGKRLAELELHVLLFHVMLNFHLAYPENETVEPVARATLMPEKPVRVKFFDRKSL